MSTKQMSFGLLLAFFFVILLSLLPSDNSYANDLVFEHIMYTSTESICNEYFIGTDWEESMQYEGLCQDIWIDWTRQIKNGTF